MNRRELIKMIAAATGTAFVGSQAFLVGCARTTDTPDYTFTDSDVTLLDEVAETIIPRTDTPGAKDAEVGKLMTVMVNDCYSDHEQRAFHEGMAKLQHASQSFYSKPFLGLNTQERQELLTLLDNEAQLYNASHSDTHYFSMIKQLTLFGFFTSKVAATQVLRYVAVPGRYDGCMPYNKGDRAWAT